MAFLTPKGCFSCRISRFFLRFQNFDKNLNQSNSNYPLESTPVPLPRRRNLYHNNKNRQNKISLSRKLSSRLKIKRSNSFQKSLESAKIQVKNLNGLCRPVNSGNLNGLMNTQLPSRVGYIRNRIIRRNSSSSKNGSRKSPSAKKIDQVKKRRASITKIN